MAFVWDEKRFEAENVQKQKPESRQESRETIDSRTEAHELTLLERR